MKLVSFSKKYPQDDFSEAFQFAEDEKSYRLCPSYSEIAKKCHNSKKSKSSTYSAML